MNGISYFFTNPKFGPPDPEFDPEGLLIQDYPYSEREIDALLEAENPQEFFLRHSAVVASKNDLSVMANSGFVSRLFSDVLTSAVDPVNYIPAAGLAGRGIGAITRTGAAFVPRVAARRGALVATAGLAGRATVDSLTAEAVLYSLDPDRTLGTMAIDTLAGAAFNTALRGAGVALRPHNRAQFTRAARGYLREAALHDVWAKKGFVPKARSIAGRVRAVLGSDITVRNVVNESLAHSGIRGSVEIQYGRIPGRHRGDRPVAALRTTRDGGHVLLIDEAAARESYENKAWTRPVRPGVAPMAENAFRSLDEWVAFVVHHEAIHFDVNTGGFLARAYGLTKDTPGLEDTINSIAYSNAVGHDSIDYLPFSAERPDADGSVLDVPNGTELRIESQTHLVYPAQRSITYSSPFEPA